MLYASVSNCTRWFVPCGIYNTRWAIISGPPKSFVYNFHCKQQNFMKFQLEVYQDMLCHIQQKFHTFESQYWLKQCATSSILSGSQTVYTLFQVSWVIVNKHFTKDIIRHKTLKITMPGCSLSNCLILETAYGVCKITNLSRSPTIQYRASEFEVIMYSMVNF